MYNWWVYTHIVNTKWFVWIVVAAIFLFNLIGPVLIWYKVSSRKMPFLKKMKYKLSKLKIFAK